MITIRRSTYTHEELVVLSMLFDQMTREICEYSTNTECDVCPLKVVCASVSRASTYAAKLANESAKSGKEEDK